jgi:hypothetical protein
MKPEDDVAHTHDTRHASRDTCKPLSQGDSPPHRPKSCSRSVSHGCTGASGVRRKAAGSAAEAASTAACAQGNAILLTYPFHLVYPFRR